MNGDTIALLPIFLSTPSARRATASFLSSMLSNAIFLSTPSARRATPEFRIMSKGIGISIHALCEEGDWAFP